MICFKGPLLYKGSVEGGEMKIFGLELSSRHVAFILIFSSLGLLLHQFNFSQIVGAVGLESKPYFNYFQFLGPIAGAVLGPIAGVVSIILVAGANLLLTGEPLALPVVVSIFTLSMAAVYFGTKGRHAAAIPLICMPLFWLHPEGLQAWYYALFWLIPLAASFYRQNILLRSLGSTFSAHAVGAVAYLYAFNIPAAAWAGLMVITPLERVIFALGITLSYYVVTTALNAFSAKTDLSFLNIEEKYSLWRV